MILPESINIMYLQRINEKFSVDYDLWDSILMLIKFCNDDDPFNLKSVKHYMNESLVLDNVVISMLKIFQQQYSRLTILIVDSFGKRMTPTK